MPFCCYWLGQAAARAQPPAGQSKLDCPPSHCFGRGKGQPGLWRGRGRAFLAAAPHGPKKMESALFVAELRSRFQVADAAEDTWCPTCDAVLDTRSHHAAVCLAGGERTQRHHAVRDLMFSWAERAGLRPDTEKPGSLLPQHLDDHRSSQRRPADVFVPAFNGAPTAFDIAITAFQRLDTLAEAGHVAAAAATAYAEMKRKHLQTAGGIVPGQHFAVELSCARELLADQSHSGTARMSAWSLTSPQIRCLWFPFCFSGGCLWAAEVVSDPALHFVVFVVFLFAQRPWTSLDLATRLCVSLYRWPDYRGSRCSRGTVFFLLRYVTIGLHVASRTFFAGPLQSFGPALSHHWFFPWSL